MHRPKSRRWGWLNDSFGRPPPPSIRKVRGCVESVSMVTGLSCMLVLIARNTNSIGIEAPGSMVPA